MLDQIILALSLAVTILFFFYGYNCYYLLKASKKYSLPGLNKHYPRPAVAIHLPIYNEKYVVERLIEHCVKMVEEYDKEAVRIIILDDSDDETSDIVDAVSIRYARDGYKIEVIRRSKRDGYKAGALQEALLRTHEEFIAIFDADFVPPKDFLTNTIPYFIEDEKVGIIQCRWGHVNRQYNWITKAVSIGIDAHFYVEQPGRYVSQCLLNFNGSAGVIRRTALLEAGGWHTDTLAEDLDASYRMQLRGYKILYLEEPHVDGEVTPTLISFKRQQARWACGSMRTAKKILPKLLTHPRLNLKQKIQGFIHLTYYSVHLLMFLAFLLAVTASLANVTSISVPTSGLNLSQPSQFVTSIGSLSIQQIAIILLSLTILTCAAATWIYYLQTIRAQSLSVTRNIPNLLILGLIGYGISISNTIEVLKGVMTKHQGEFKRTPKYSVKSKEDSWRDKKYHVPLDKKVLVEWISMILGLIAVYFAYKTGNFGILPILIWYVVAYVFVNMFTLIQCGKEK